MLKPAETLMQADPRSDQFVLDHGGAGWRRMRMEDLHDQMRKLELGPSVPQRIREQFDIARNAFVYSAGTSRPVDIKSASAP